MTDPWGYIEDEVKEQLINVLKKLNFDGEIVVAAPPEGMGDFSFPCFALSKIAKKGPMRIAEEIAKNIEKSEFIESVENKGAYVNFFINSDKLAEITLRSITKEKEDYGNLDKKHEKIILEHTSANPTGPLHVGRARNPIIGDTLARILRKSGYDVETQFYVDDMGKQTAVLAWGKRKIGEEEIEKEKGEKIDHTMVKYYQKANELMEKKEEINKEIESILLEIDKPSHLLTTNEEILKTKKAREEIKRYCQLVLDGIIQSLERIDVFIDSFVWESELIDEGVVNDVIKKLKTSSHYKEEDGVGYIEMEDFGVSGMDTRFFITRKDGTSLYATRDIAYHLSKSQHYDKVIDVLGEDHKFQTRKVNVGLKLLGVKKLPEIIFYAFVSLPEGKMATRKGRVVWLDDLIDEAVKRAHNEVKKRRAGLPEEKMQEIAQIVGIGSIRYNIIRVQAEKKIVFRWEDALNFEGNSAPFIQYAHARACSILRKSGGYGDYQSSLLIHESEKNLIRNLAKFPAVIGESAEGRKCHLIAAYAYQLASLFNQFYRDCLVLHADENLRNARLVLVDATRLVLKNALDCLGIAAPEEM